MHTATRRKWWSTLRGWCLFSPCPSFSTICNVFFQVNIDDAANNANPKYILADYFLNFNSSLSIFFLEREFIRSCIEDHWCHVFMFKLGVEWSSQKWSRPPAIMSSSCPRQLCALGTHAMGVSPACMAATPSCIQIFFFKLRFLSVINIFSI